MSNNIPVFHLEATELDNLPGATRVINKSQAEHFLMVSTDVLYTGSEFQLYQMDEVTDKGCVQVNLDVQHECGRVWYQLPFEQLNQSPGHHKYRMRFVQTQTGLTVSLYFAYILQDDNPEKPYIYMKRDEVAVDE